MDNKKNSKLKIKFWGVRGSCPTPGADTVKYGGNTPCVQISTADKNIIIDAGTGICKLGDELERESQGRPLTLDIFFTHLHWDHIQGFPFFSPIYHKKNVINIYASSAARKYLKTLMSEPYFPVHCEELKSEINFIELQDIDTVNFPESGININTIPGHHFEQTRIYRVEYRGKSCTYLSDYEHFSDDQDIVKFIKNSDLLIYDSHFTDEEYMGSNGNYKRMGWGHSTWQEGIKMAEKSMIDKLLLFHHAPERTDEELDKIQEKARGKFPNVRIAREGMVIEL